MGSSASSVAGLLHPAADPGVRRVSVPHAPVKPVRSTLSRDAGPTLRRNPRRKPLCVTADLALLAVLSGSPPALDRFHRWRSCSESVGGSGTSASRPCSVVGSGVSRSCCQLQEVRSFLGFFPLQGSSSNDRGSHALAVPLATSEDIAHKLRFAPVRDCGLHRSEVPFSVPGTAAHRGEQGGYRARGAGSWLSRARSEDRVGRCARRDWPKPDGEGHCERGSSRSCPGIPPASESLRGFTARACTYGRAAVASELEIRPFHLGLRWSGVGGTSMPSKSVRS
jgi:hypothetical protein